MKTSRKGSNIMFLITFVYVKHILNCENTLSVHKFMRVYVFVAFINISAYEIIMHAMLHLCHFKLI